MSDRLDIVRLIDARVTSTRRTVTRSRQLAEAARGELHIHEDWIRQHNERFGHDLKRQQRRMNRRERIENNRRFAKSALLFLPRLVTSLCRCIVSGLRKAGDAFGAGCVWVGRAGSASSRSLIGLLGHSGALAGSQALRLGLMLLAALWLASSFLAKGAWILALAVAGASLEGLAWLGPKASNFGQRLSASASLRLSRFGAFRGIGLGVDSGAKRRATHLRTRSRRMIRASQHNQAVDLDPSRLQQAAFISLRAEHERLQSRIHAMDRHYEQRIPQHGREEQEWVELRKLALNARRLFEAQERQVLGAAASRKEGASPSATGEGNPPRDHNRDLSAGQAIYRAPALPAGHRRA